MIERSRYPVERLVLEVRERGQHAQQKAGEDNSATAHRVMMLEQYQQHSNLETNWSGSVRHS
eukprot:12914154-Prorocentrum_lima.AAC.1